MTERRFVLTDLFGARQDFDEYDWRPFRDGVEIARLYGDGQHGPSTALLRYAPGASVPEHVHRGAEHIFVLAGSQRDERGVYAAGTCVIHLAGTRHRVSSEHGCVVLAVWEMPVVFVDGDA